MDPNFIMVDVENPYHNPGYPDGGSNPRRTKAVIRLQESPVMFMLARGYVTEPQAHAGTEFRRIFEDSLISPLQAMDTMKEPVDGGSYNFDNFSDKQLRAIQDLQAVKDKLGPEAYALVEAVCGKCFFIKQLSSKRREQDKISAKFKDALHTLALFWGYETTPIRAERIGA